MDKITRIHIAKTPYEIGYGAEKDLKSYLEAIRRQLDADSADEIMADIEVRVTELLSEAGTKRNEIITMKDIQAVKDQLGSPEQFSDSDGPAKEPERGSGEPKRLMRDPDGAYLGGVASGLGLYFGIDPIVIRILFVVLAFATGLGFVLYILLWVLIPQAKTNSDKLIMRGQSVTAATLSEYRDASAQMLPPARVRVVLIAIARILRVLVTVGIGLAILGLLSGIGFASAVLYTQPVHQLFVSYHLNFLLVGLLWLFTATVIGLFIVVLWRLWRRRSASMGISFIALLGILILTMSALAVTAPFVVSHYRDAYGGNKLSVATPVRTMPGAPTPTGLVVSADKQLVVQYDTTTGPVHATYQSYPGMGQPDLAITNQDGAIRVSTGQLGKVVPPCVLDWCQRVYLPVRVTIYGPALTSYSVDGGAELDAGTVVANSLDAQASNGSNLFLGNSYAASLNLSAKSGSSVDASDTTAQSATVTVSGDSMVLGPASDNLRVNMPTQCDQPVLDLAQPPVSVAVNGQAVSGQSLEQNDCVSADIPFPAGQPVAPMNPRIVNVQAPIFRKP